MWLFPCFFSRAGVPVHRIEKEDSIQEHLWLKKSYLIRATVDRGRK